MANQKSKKIIKSNQLNNSNFCNFELSVYRVFLSILTKVQNRVKDNKDKNININREYSFSAKEYADEFNIPKNTAYDILKKSASKLMRTPFSLPKVKKGDDEGLLEISICSQAFYVKNKGRIDIEFSEKIIPHLMGIKNKFTMYNICEISEFHSIYTVRFYELLMQYKTTGKLDITIEALRHSLGCNENYKFYNDLKRHVINHAVKEINSHYEINIKFKEIKDGRAVDRLEFSFKKTEIDQVYDPVTKKTRNQLTRPKKKKTDKQEKSKETTAREAFSELAEKLRVSKK